MKINLILAQLQHNSKCPIIILQYFWYIHSLYSLYAKSINIWIWYKPLFQCTGFSFIHLKGIILILKTFLDMECHFYFASLTWSWQKNHGNSGTLFILLVLELFSEHFHWSTICVEEPTTILSHISIQLLTGTDLEGKF